MAIATWSIEVGNYNNSGSDNPAANRNNNSDNTNNNIAFRPVL